MRGRFRCFAVRLRSPKKRPHQGLPRFVLQFDALIPLQVDPSRTHQFLEEIAMNDSLRGVVFRSRINPHGSRCATHHTGISNFRKTRLVGTVGRVEPGLEPDRRRDE